MTQEEAKARLDERTKHERCWCQYTLAMKRVVTCDRCAELEQILENAKVPDKVRF